jgi:hypothetical protein
MLRVTPVGSIGNLSKWHGAMFASSISKTRKTGGNGKGWRAWQAWKMCHAQQDCNSIDNKHARALTHAPADDIHFSYAHVGTFLSTVPPFPVPCCSAGVWSRVLMIFLPTRIRHTRIRDGKAGRIFSGQFRPAAAKLSRKMSRKRTRAACCRNAPGQQARCRPRCTLHRRQLVKILQAWPVCSNLVKIPQRTQRLLLLSLLLILL